MATKKTAKKSEIIFTIPAAAEKKTVKGPFVPPKGVPSVATKPYVHNDTPAPTSKASFTAQTVPKSIRALFSDAKYWTKGVLEQRKDGHAQYCLLGAINHVYGDDPKKREEVQTKLETVIKGYTVAENGGYSHVMSFNDNNSTNFVDIQRVVAIAGV